jgi:hypothetical protein
MLILNKHNQPNIKILINKFILLKIKIKQIKQAIFNYNKLK